MVQVALLLDGKVCEGLASKDALGSSPRIRQAFCERVTLFHVDQRTVPPTLDFFQLAAQQFLFWEYECAANATGVMCSIIVIIEAMRRLIIDLMAATFPCCDWRNGSCNRLIVRDSNRDLVVTNQPIEVVWVAEFEPSLSVISNDVLVSVKCSWSSRQLV
jgi:hypothetical protein